MSTQRSGAPSDRPGAETGHGLPRLLIVEDDPYDTELELMQLRRHGLSFEEICVATCEADYVARLADFRPDVILADYRLPGLLGERTLELALAHQPEIPFIFVSGTLGEDRAVELLKQGAWDYVLKDRPSRLGPVVSRSLQEARAHQQLKRDRELALAQVRRGREQLQAIVDTVPDALALFQSRRDPDGRIGDFVCSYANPITLSVLRRPLEAVVGRTLLEILPSLRDSTTFEQYVRVAEDGGQAFHLLHDLPEAPGVFEGRAAGLGDGFVVALHDVTDQHRAQQELRASEERFRLAFDEALIGMALIDVTLEPGRFLRVNRALGEFLGYAESDLLSMTFADVTVADDLDAVQAAIQGLVAGMMASYRAEHRYVDAEGSTVWGLFSISLVQDRDQDRGIDPLYALAAVEDITARKLAEQELAFRALHDELTGLPNRALLLDHLHSALARAQRDDTVVGVIFIDLDDFKSVNDSFGHGAGDSFLVQVSERIAGILRETDTAARIGGDEFVVVCESLPDPSLATSVAHRIQATLARGVLVQGQRIGASASIGIAISTERSTPETLLRDADSAMYVAKRQGGRRWEPADALLHAAAVRVLSLEADLRDAVRDSQLRLHYQPTYELRTGRLIAMEALLRWHHPTRGLLLPEEFIDVAERRNLIGPIGNWVLHTACEQASAWMRRFGPASPLIAVNVSSQQLGDQGLAPQVISLLAYTGLPANRLCLEITETQFVSAGTSASSDLRALSEAGITLAVDDFGTGFAGFDYLRRLPVDTLKIDKSFVAGLALDPTDAAIVASIVTLAHKLGLTVIAEGIETEEQLRLLRDLGCTWGQGWLWHPALPPEEVEELLGACLRGPP